MTLKEKVEKLIKDGSSYNNSYLAAIEELKASDQYSESYKQNKISEIEQVMEKNNDDYNKKITELIISQKALYIERKGNKPEDYQLKITTALEFIKTLGNSLNDDTLSGILEPFQKDYEMLKLFHAVVTNLLPPDEMSALNKSFGRFEAMRALDNKLENVSKTTAILFNRNEDSLAYGLKVTALLKELNDADMLIADIST